MKKIIFIFGLFFIGTGLNSYATKLINIQVVDNEYIMLYFKDGEVFYKDDGKGPSGYTGHDYAPGDDRLETYGEALNVDITALPASWKIFSSDDIYYKNGIQPVRVSRKSKANNVANNWLYKSDHWIFLKLPSPLKEGSTYKVTIAGETKTDKTEISFTYDIFNCLSEAIHVNTIGYTPNSPIKQADLYYWLGDMGHRDYSKFVGKIVWLYNIETKEKHQVGTVKFWKANIQEVGRSLTGSPVWSADINNFNTPGKYRLAIEGVGCSQDFEIKNDLYFLPFKTSVRGYYYMRIGEDRMDMVPVPRRPLFIEGKDPIDTFKVYITDLDPWDQEWKEKSGDQWDEPHWKPFDRSMFWKRRVEGHPTNPNAYGGHSDALDWDRHLAHVSDAYDLLLPYFLSKGKLNDDNLNIGESGNGIPDLIDEARNEIDFFLRLRYKGGYSQGLTNPDGSHKYMMFQAGNTTMAAWANAANAAMLSDCFRLSGNKKLMETYRDSSIVAFNYAEKQKNKMEGILQDIGDADMTVHDFKMMAAAFLYNVTGDTKWENIMERECVITSMDTPVQKDKSHCQFWGCAAYIFSPQKQNKQTLLKNMKLAMLNQAQLENLSEMKSRPSRRSGQACWWQTAENLHAVIISHAFSDQEDLKKRLAEALLSEYEWGLGRNPMNMVEMTGLGNRPFVNIYTSGRNDGSPGLHPGHTPYNNLGTWDTHNQGGSDPQWFVKRSYPDWSSWPHQEGYFNCRYSWSNGEFTPRQTMRGKMALYGYLYSIQDSFKK
jgi:endoglucanase